MIEEDFDRSDQGIRAPINILLAEDDSMEAKVTFRAFKEARIQNNIFVVHDGQQVLDFIFHKGLFNDEHQYPRPDVILMDINMSGMSGLYALKKIKSNVESRAIPVVMLSSSRRQEDIRESYETGASGYISKPVDYQDFVRMVNVFNEFWCTVSRLPQYSRDDVLSTKVYEPCAFINADEGQNILVIDDDPQYLRILSILLKKEGFTCIETASTGEEGLEKMKAHCPAVVVLDTVLPRKDGFEICSQIKESWGERVKVILNTGVLDAVDAGKAKQAGADQYMAKTMDSKGIVDAVKTILSGG